MTTGIKDQDLIILDKLDDKSLFQLCKTNKYVQRFCKDEDFWKERLFKNYGYAEKNKNRTWKDFYLNIVYYDNKLKDDDSTGFEFGDFFPGTSLGLLSKKGIKNIDLINFFINKGVDKDDLNWAMEEAAKAGDKKLIEFLIDKGADDWNRGMLRAIESGKLSLVKYFVIKGANHHWDTGLRYSAREGDIEMAEYFLKKGAYNLTEALEEALDMEDNYEMIDFLQRTIKFRKWHYSRTPMMKYRY